MSTHQFSWTGKTDTHLNGPVVQSVGHVVIGLHGGNSAHGARKNEDAALLWLGRDWVFAVVLDAHNSTESADRVLGLFEEWRSDLEAICNRGKGGDFRTLEQAIVTRLLVPENSALLSDVQGETACLICFQRGPYLMWISIGDNSLYLLHPELARLGQYTLSVRNYFEWVGERNSLTLDAACYASGVRQLRSGLNTIALATDGILEFGDRSFENPDAFSTAILVGKTLSDGVAAMLAHAHQSGAIDSTTIIAWQFNNPHSGLMPTG